jgi:hypothetical protein
VHDIGLFIDFFDILRPIAHVLLKDEDRFILLSNFFVNEKLTVHSHYISHFCISIFHQLDFGFEVPCQPIKYFFLAEHVAIQEHFFDSIRPVFDKLDKFSECLALGREPFIRRAKGVIYVEAIDRASAGEFDRFEHRLAETEVTCVQDGAPRRFEQEHDGPRAVIGREEVHSSALDPIVSVHFQGNNVRRQVGESVEQQA